VSLDKTIKARDLKTFKVIKTIEEESDNKIFYLSLNFYSEKKNLYYFIEI
jgi:hypothetical protein